MSRPGFYFCFCPDPNLIRMQIDRMLESSGQKKWQKKTIWTDDQDNEDILWKSLNIPGIFGPPRAVVLRHCQSLTDKFWTDISPVLSGFRPSIWPFFCFESEWKKGKPGISAKLSKKKYFRFARGKGWIWEFPGLTRKNISRYILQKAEKLGIKPGPGVVEDLCAMLPLDSQGVDMEMEKLALLAQPEKILSKKHLLAVSSQPDIDIFSFLQKIQNGKNMSEAWNKIFREQQKGKEILFPFLGLLLREARILWQLSTGQEDKVSLFPGIKKQKAALARSMGQMKISLLWDLALEAESGVKSGMVSTGEAMDSLTAKLFKLFSR